MCSESREVIKELKLWFFYTLHIVSSLFSHFVCTIATHNKTISVHNRERWRNMRTRQIKVKNLQVFTTCFLHFGIAESSLQSHKWFSFSLPPLLSRHHYFVIYVTFMLRTNANAKKKTKNKEQWYHTMINENIPKAKHWFSFTLSSNAGVENARGKKILEGFKWI